MGIDRENLIRENFEHERDFHYLKFREHHWMVAEVVDACPDENHRDKMLRGFWNQDAEKRYPEYRATVAGLSTTDLLNEREQWLEKLDCLGMLAYREELRKAAFHPSNDNDKGRDR